MVRTQHLEEAPKIWMETLNIWMETVVVGRGPQHLGEAPGHRLRAPSIWTVTSTSGGVPGRCCCSQMPSIKLGGISWQVLLGWGHWGRGGWQWVGASTHG